MQKSTLACSGMLLLSLLIYSKLIGQTRHYDYLGAGHKNEIKVTASSNSGMSERTVDGFSISNAEQLKDASRFLAQATFGADYATIQTTAAMGYEAWLNEQFALPQGSLYAKMREFEERYDLSDIETEPVSGEEFRKVWLTVNMTSPDILRQRMGFVMSQIFVVNDISDLFEDHGQASAVYYDLLTRNSFTNYKSMIKEVTYSPFMANFLTYLNNPKADPERNIQPDENYAREIMQLFSIGLWELNQDGTRKYDANGNFIPTYDNNDIDEFAEVFTGLEYSFENEDEENFAVWLTSPLRMNEEIHDTSDKILLNDYVIPANRPGDVDIDLTLNHLSEHPNTAPFISKAIIQFLTTSNPSPRYVRDVVNVFNPYAENNFQEVIKAILLHPEARQSVTERYTFGKLREPFVRYMNFLKAFPISAENNQGDYIHYFDDFQDMAGQSPLFSPSVFNFFRPDYQPRGPITQNYYVAPEFQILNSTNSIGFINHMDYTIFDEFVFEGSEEREISEDAYQLDIETEIALAETPKVLVDHLDILLANGLLSEDTKSIISSSISQIEDEYERIGLAVYLIMISPDYAILK